LAEFTADGNSYG